MNFNCIICRDILSPSSVIYSTVCGHIFHHPCLLQWTERSKTCPQCRQKVTDKSIHRIYFNIQATDGITEDAETLLNRIDGLNFQLKLKDKEIKLCTDKYIKTKSETFGLREEVKKLEGTCRTTESAMYALKEEVKFHKQKLKENNGLREEITKLKEKLSAMEAAGNIISASYDEVLNTVNDNTNPAALSLLVHTLKKALSTIDAKTNKLSTEKDRLVGQLSLCKREKENLKKELQAMRVNLERFKGIEKEKCYLKEKVCKLEAQLEANNSSHTPDKSVLRIINESPTPLQPDLNQAVVDLDLLESPSLDERVRRIQESDSPYLQIKSSSSVPNFLNAKIATYNDKPNLKPGTSKSTFLSRASTSVSTSNSDYCYNGLGGHSKIDKFPSTIKKSNVLKRPKSSSALTSTKFRKLSDNKKKPDFTRPSQ